MNWVVYRTGEDESEEFETLDDAIKSMNELLSVSRYLSKKYADEAIPYPRLYSKPHFAEWQSSISDGK